jgi:dolichol kinase
LITEPSAAGAVAVELVAVFVVTVFVVAVFAGFAFVFVVAVFAAGLLVFVVVAGAPPQADNIVASEIALTSEIICIFIYIWGTPVIIQKG